MAQAISRGITKSGVGVQTLNLEQCRCSPTANLSACSPDCESPAPKAVLLTRQSVPAIKCSVPDGALLIIIFARTALRRWRRPSAGQQASSLGRRPLADTCPRRYSLGKHSVTTQQCMQNWLQQLQVHACIGAETSLVCNLVLYTKGTPAQIGLWPHDSWHDQCCSGRV